MNNCIFAGEALNGRSGHKAGRELLHQLYTQHYGDNIPEILIGDRGKPYFSTGNVHFSISHTSRHVFCVLADEEIGIDAEELDRTVKPALAKKILSAAELAQYEIAADKNKALLTFWVLKEASVKASGEGLRGYPNQTDFSLHDPRVTEHNGCLVAVIRKEKSHAF